LALPVHVAKLVGRAGQAHVDQLHPEPVGTGAVAGDPDLGGGDGTLGTGFGRGRGGAELASHADVYPVGGGVGPVGAPDAPVGDRLDDLEGVPARAAEPPPQAVEDQAPTLVAQALHQLVDDRGRGLAGPGGGHEAAREGDECDRHDEEAADRGRAHLSSPLASTTCRGASARRPRTFMGR